MQTSPTPTRTSSIVQLNAHMSSSNKLIIHRPAHCLQLPLRQAQPSTPTPPLTRPAQRILSSPTKLTAPKSNSDNHIITCLPRCPPVRIHQSHHHRPSHYLRVRRRQTHHFFPTLLVTRPTPRIIIRSPRAPHFSQVQLRQAIHSPSTPFLTSLTQAKLSSPVRPNAYHPNSYNQYKSAHLIALETNSDNNIIPGPP